MSETGDTADDASGLGEEHRSPIQARAEPRTPVLVAVLVAMVLPILMPEGFTPGPKWFWPTIEGVFLVAVAITNPGRIDRRSKEVRAVRSA